MDLRDIQNLIKFVAKSGASEVKLEMEDIKITIKTGSEKTETTREIELTLPYYSKASLDLFFSFNASFAAKAFLRSSSFLSFFE